MIPKIIHYCWFGHNKMNKKIIKCIESWKKYCPDFTFMKWDETNCDINENEYVRQAYEMKKWAFVSDYFRAKVLFLYGGIYLDTDMLLLNNFDFALNNSAFCCFAKPGIVSMGLIGLEKGHHLIEKHYNDYSKISFYKQDGSLNLETNVTKFSNMLKEEGLGEEDKIYHLKDITVYSSEYFYPTDFEGYRKNFTSNTCAVHLHEASWLPINKKINAKTTRIIHSSFIYRIYAKIRGIKV